MTTGEKDNPQFSKFTNVDASQELQKFVTFLDTVESYPQQAEIRRLSYGLLNLKPGGRVCDVGCGTGTAVHELAEKGFLTSGVDNSTQMIDIARQRHSDDRFEVATAESLPFEDGYLQGYRAERLYQHLLDPAIALKEAFRVIASGGRIILIDQDFDTLAVDSDDHATTRALTRAFCDTVKHGWIGRRYYGLLKEAGFQDVEVEVSTKIYTRYEQMFFVIQGMANAGKAAGIITGEQAEAWVSDQKRRSEEGRFFLAMPFFMGIATRP